MFLNFSFYYPNPNSPLAFVFATLDTAATISSETLFTAPCAGSGSKFLISLLCEANAAEPNCARATPKALPSFSASLGSASGVAALPGSPTVPSDCVVSFAIAASLSV